MSKLQLRVNGIDIDKLKLRPKMVAGVPRGKREVVIEDPKLGSFPIDDSFIIETRNSPRKKWEPTSVESLIQSIELIVNDTNSNKEVL